jgi:hypothetical protein
VVGYLPNKLEFLNSNPSTERKKKSGINFFETPVNVEILTSCESQMFLMGSGMGTPI